MSAPARRRSPAHPPHRARLLLVAAAVFAVVVAVSSFPAEALLAQHRQLSSTSVQVTSLEDQNDALSRQAGHLGDPSTVEQLARSDFGFVRPGQRAYDVLPPSGSSSSGADLSGHVPLDGPPVAPGSAQSSSLLGAGNAPAGAPAPTGGQRAAPAAPPATGSGTSFLGRLAGALEFWR